MSFLQWVLVYAGIGIIVGLITYYSNFFFIKRRGNDLVNFKDEEEVDLALLVMFIFAFVGAIFWPLTIIFIALAWLIFLLSRGVK